MSDTYSPALKARLIQSGTLPETWGAALNSDAISLLDSAIAGRKVITLTGLTYSLGALTAGADAESRYMALQFIGDRDPKRAREYIKTRDDRMEAIADRDRK